MTLAQSVWCDEIDRANQQDHVAGLTRQLPKKQPYVHSLPLTAPHDHLIADCSGALIWPDERLVVIADLHLEKGSSFVRKGSAIPPYDSHASIERLTEVLSRWSPDRVISLGDSFHDSDGCNRLSGTNRRTIQKLTSRFDWIWISGNHDPSPPKDLGGQPAEEIAINGVTFRHLPSDRTERSEIAGHLHPKARVKARGRRVSRPCFVSDHRRVLLPAFGSYTGGLDVLDPAVSTLFPDDYRAYLLGDDRIHMVARHQIERAAH